MVIFGEGLRIAAMTAATPRPPSSAWTPSQSSPNRPGQ